VNFEVEPIGLAATKDMGRKTRIVWCPENLEKLIIFIKKILSCAKCSQHVKSNESYELSMTFNSVNAVSYLSSSE
jgi:hypothetical protein